MKYISSIILAIALLSSCGTDAEKTPSTVKSNSNTASPKSAPAVAPPIIESDTYGGQLVSLSRIYLKYSNNGSAKTNEVKTELTKITHKDLAKAKGFIFELTQRSSKLLSNTYLRKPTKKELQAIYQFRFINWNSMSTSAVTETVLDNLDLEKTSDTDLLTAYYSMLVAPLATNRLQADVFGAVDINLNELGLENEKEKGIVFYKIASKFARKYELYARSQKDNCNKTKQMSRSFPKINGKSIFEVTPPSFKDFNFVMSNNRPNASFNKMHSPSFEKAKAHYLGCKF